MITKYGYSTVGIAVIIAFVIFAIAIFTGNNYIKYTFIIIGIIIVLFTLNFFRDPDRSIPNKENVIVSPADGKVLIIKDIFEDKFINEDCTQISIFMSPINVHVNRIPISGKVDYLKYIEGEYLVAYHDKADEKNERSEIGITGKHTKVLFTQVAGMVARRIVYELSEGDSVNIGERFGMIKFGSRVDVIVPKTWDVKIAKDQFVKAGETILFELNK
jgi:phosphatidylserine decarboxylase